MKPPVIFTRSPATSDRDMPSSRYHHQTTRHPDNPVADGAPNPTDREFCRSRARQTGQKFITTSSSAWRYTPRRRDGGDHLRNNLNGNAGQNALSSQGGCSAPATYGPLHLMNNARAIGINCLPLRSDLHLPLQGFESWSYPPVHVHCICAALTLLHILGRVSP